ncbi:unnamed protein product [Ranitomeya imitator]|uniref:Uncharacterized protein n=1 Tax=Ranitomeya imitator TaxID=111125 RepID=A0ABN9LLK3_9NEOB|nr:unnamed protein product [Ranitomeya imitator]
MTSRSHDRDVIAGPSPIPLLAREPDACMERSPKRHEERERSFSRMRAGPVMTSRSHDRDVMAGPSLIPPEPAACMERSEEWERWRKAATFLTNGSEDTFIVGENDLGISQFIRRKERNLIPRILLQDVWCLCSTSDP